jgi:hypothetical protein
MIIIILIILIICYFMCNKSNKENYQTSTNVVDTNNQEKILLIKEKGSYIAQNLYLLSKQLNQNPEFESTETYSSKLSELKQKLSEMETLFSEIPNSPENTFINNFINSTKNIIIILKDGLNNVKNFEEQMKNRFNSQQNQQESS